MTGTVLLAQIFGANEILKTSFTKYSSRLGLTPVSLLRQIAEAWTASQRAADLDIINPRAEARDTACDNRKKLTMQMKKRIVRYHHTGMRAEEIARAVGVAPTTVRRHLKSLRQDVSEHPVQSDAEADAPPPRPGVSEKQQHQAGTDVTVPVAPRRPRIPPATREAIITGLKNGEPVNTIARRLSIKHHTVTMIRKRAGLPGRQHFLSVEQKRTIEQLIDDGISSSSEIARRVGCGKSHVCRLRRQIQKGTKCFGQTR